MAVDAGVVVGAAAAAGADGAGAPPVRMASTTAITSSRVIRPPPPVPVTCSGPRPCSRRSRRTAGVMRASASPTGGADSAGAGAADATGAGSGAADATGAGAGAGSTAAAVATTGRAPSTAGAEGPGDSAPSAVSISAIGVSLGTVAPSSTRMAVRVPATGDGTSAFTLSVITSTRASYFSTRSPGFFSQRPIVPSATLSPSCGIVTFATWSLLCGAVPRITTSYGPGVPPVHRAFGPRR